MKWLSVTSSVLTALLVLNSCTDTQKEEKSKSLRVNISPLGIEQEWSFEVNRGSWYELTNVCKGRWRAPNMLDYYLLLENGKSIDEQLPNQNQLKEFWTIDNYDDSKAWKVSSWSNTNSYRDKNSSLGIRCIKNIAYSSSLDINKLKIENLEDKPYSHVDAIAICENKGNGWRLPAIYELKMMRHEKKLEGGEYWSSTQMPLNDNSYMILDTIDGFIDFASTYESYRVACVKDKSTKFKIPNLDINRSKLPSLPFLGDGNSSGDIVDKFKQIVGGDGEQNGSTPLPSFGFGSSGI